MCEFWGLKGGGCESDSLTFTGGVTYVVQTDIVDGFMLVDFFRQLKAMWPLSKHLKQCPSARYCFHSPSISFLDRTRGWMLVKTSTGTIPLLFRVMHARFEHWAWPVWNVPKSHGFCLLWKLSLTPTILNTLWTSDCAASCHLAIVAGSVSWLKMNQWTLSFKPHTNLSIVHCASASHPAAAVSLSNVAV